MKRTAVAVAHPNIALSKYWGKRGGEGNVPAVPSLSVTLDGLVTRTRVTFDPALSSDLLVLNGAAADSTRATQLLDRVRELAKIDTRARVESTNDFPTASGLASSASGFAALALAAVRAAGLDLPQERVAELARRTSASAARSIFGGFVELDGESVRVVAPGSALDLRVLVCVTQEGEKAISSTEAMKRTAAESPYYAAWLEEAPKIHREIVAALGRGDFDAVGALAQRSALAMHACAMAAGIVFFKDATLAALAEVRALGAYATMDAGPHVKCLVRGKDAEAARARLEKVSGVLRVIVARPGDGARIEEEAR